MNRRPDLVIGYGNTLRGDDAVGRRIADAVDAWALPGVRVFSRHQLTPELAADIAEAGRVFFVDAGPETALTHLHPQVSAHASTHRTDPGDLLALAQHLYGAMPEAILLTVQAGDFELGADLSETTRHAMNDAMGRLKVILSPSH